MFPPPNVTGSLHLGHALTGAVQDAIVRQRRMQGFNCQFIPGFDHAGLATQNIVEKLLGHQHNITRQKYGREKFTKLVHEWKDQKRAEIKNQLDRLGLDLDHHREYFTMDENSSHAVQAAFKQLFNSGIIYRAVKPIFWSNQLQTTLSDIEVERINDVDRYVRTGEVVERRPLSQWFINAQEMARRAVEVVQSESIKIVPSSYKKTWSSWLLQNGVQDWCISRQSWWGHRIPAYKVDSTLDVTDSWVVADNLEEARNRLCTQNDVIQDPDVLDTWFSSSLLPLTVSGWPHQDKFAHSCDNGLFPMHIMETGFDILTYWVTKMVMVSLALTSKIPFNLVLLHGMICDSKGKKMSKSRGNVIDPIDVIDGASIEKIQQRTIDAYVKGTLDEGKLNVVLENQRRLFPRGIPSCGADGLRAYLLSQDFQEEVVRIRIEQIEKVRRLSNKIWNIFRFYLNLVEEDEHRLIKLNMGDEDLDKTKFSRQDQQVLKHLASCVAESHEAFGATYQLQHCFKKLEYFWTVHLSQEFVATERDVLSGQRGTEEERKSKLKILTFCVITATKLTHPFMPHLTEFLFQKLAFQVGELNDGDEIKLLTYESFPSLDDMPEEGIQRLEVVNEKSTRAD